MQSMYYDRLHEQLDEYLDRCERVRRLSGETLRAYRSDLNQLLSWLEERSDSSPSETSGTPPIDRSAVLDYVSWLNERYAPASVRRKIASAQAFFTWRSEQGLGASPFAKLHLSMREPERLPRVIPSSSLKALFAPETPSDAESVRATYLERRDRAITELLIATGMRVGELCALDLNDLDLIGRRVRIFGKGRRERVAMLESGITLAEMARYLEARYDFAGNENEPALFLSWRCHRLSTAAARDAVHREAQRYGIQTNITPHMFRHTFATLLLEQDVDIRYIQAFLGHSTLAITERYVHVSSAKMRRVMQQANPRDTIERGGLFGFDDTMYEMRA